MSAMIMSKIKTSFSVWWCRVRGLLIGASELGLVDNFFFPKLFFLADAERVFRGFTHFMVTENWKSPTALYQKSIRWSFHLNGATEDSQKGDLFYAGNWSSIKTPIFKGIGIQQNLWSLLLLWLLNWTFISPNINVPLIFGHGGLKYVSSLT